MMLRACTFGKNFVTVTKGAEADWVKVEDKICDLIEDHIKHGDPVVLEDKSPAKPEKEYEGVEKQPTYIIEGRGSSSCCNDKDIVYKGLEDGIVYLQMIKVPVVLAQPRTLKMGIEMRLKEAIPEVKEVVNV